MLYTTVDRSETLKEENDMLKFAPTKEEIAEQAKKGKGKGKGKNESGKNNGGKGERDRRR